MPEPKPEPTPRSPLTAAISEALAAATAAGSAFGIIGDVEPLALAAVTGGVAIVVFVVEAARLRTKQTVTRQLAIPLVVALAVGFGAGLLAAALFGDDDAGEPKAVTTPIRDCRPASLTTLSPADLRAQRVKSDVSPVRLEKPIRLPARPRSLAVTDDGVWVTLVEAEAIVRISPDQASVVGRRIPVGGTPWSIAASEDVIWVTREDGVLVAIDRRSRQRIGEYRYGDSASEVTLGAGSLWVNHYGGRYDGKVSRISPCLDEEPRRISIGERANTVKFAAGFVWVSNSEENSVHRIDPNGNTVTPIDLPIGDPQDIGAGGGFIWVAGYGSKQVVRIPDDDVDVVGDPIPTGSGPGAAAVAPDAVWLPNFESDTVTRIEVKTRTSDPDAATVGPSPTDVVLGHDRVWVAVNAAEPPIVAVLDP